jgi:anti-anti-sigma factor
MNITRHSGDPSLLRLALAGELDLATVDQLRLHVKQELITYRSPSRLVVDLAEVSFCDSTGLGALLAAQTDAADHDIALHVINPSGMTRKVMQATGLLEILTGRTND